MSAPRQAVTYGGENQQQDGTKEIPTLKGNAILACLMVTYVLCNLLASYIFIALERQNDINLQLSAYHDPGWFVNSTHDFLSLTEACITTSDLTLFVQVREQFGFTEPDKSWSLLQWNVPLCFSITRTTNAFSCCKIG